MNPGSKTQRLDKSDLANVYDFLESIFTQEQQIPKTLIPLSHPEQHWWGFKENNNITGTVAAWKDGSDWHWGRLAVSPSLRGTGLGKKLALKSFKELFDTGISIIVIDARDVTVNLLLSLGAELTGDTTSFYDIPITPMTLSREGFYSNS